jgi:hypothetical protein
MERWGDNRWDGGATVNKQIEAWESELLSTEHQITRLRARQVELIRNLDRFQVDCADGARTMGDWTSASLDLSLQTAIRLTQIAKAHDPEIDEAMSAGIWGLDRSAALVKLRAAGIAPDLFIEVAANYSLGRLYGLLDRMRNIDPLDEQAVFEQRYLVMQPSLDQSAFKLWGLLPGTDGRIIEKALQHRETDLPVLPDQGNGQRRADALTSICLDSLTGTDPAMYPADDWDTDATPEPPVPGAERRAVIVAEIFIDATQAIPTHGQRGATVSSGPRVGPNTLSEILCTGQVQVTITDGLRPISYSDLGEAIPPHIRRYVLWRDQGQCSIAGCPSHYRLQPHHIKPREFYGNNHDPEDLATLCWFHHHVAIHGLGYQLDPESPKHRRRLISRRGSGPPLGTFRPEVLLKT